MLGLLGEQLVELRVGGNILLALYSPHFSPPPPHPHPEQIPFELWEYYPSDYI